MKPLRCLASLVVFALAAIGLAADPLRLDARPTFSGPQGDTSVVTVYLENDGPDARGVLQVSGQAGPVSYPVELPRGARKRLLTLPDLDWGVIDFTLQTDRGTVVHHMPGSHASPDAGGAVALIGDDSGGLAFLRRQTEGNRSVTTRDAYVKPEDAPGRPVAYRDFTAVVLGPGAERMGDDTVAALRDYALGGGSVVVLGGASAPILEDGRWAALLPGRDWRPRTLASSAVLAQAGDVPVPGPFTVLAPGELAKGAFVQTDRGVPIETKRSHGLGRVVVLGYSPLEPPLSVWPGRVRAMSRFVRGGDAQRSHGLLSAYLRSNGGSEYAGTTSPSTAPGFSPRPLPSEGDPFSTRLPAAKTVFGILLAYFVLVVPVSFLVLRKMKRGEWAWVTAPLLALGFAGVLFKSAESLYAAALSTASRGLLVLQEGAPSAMFYGTSQMFFPRGGVYDLRLENVDSMTGVQENDDYGFGMRPNSEGLEGFNLVDVGTVRAPRLEANNLAFRELSYTQRVDADAWFGFERVDKGHVRVRNRSPYPFTGRLAGGRFLGPSFSLEPGAAAVAELGVGNPAPEGKVLAYDDVRNFTGQSGRIALSGTVQGFRPGPQIGKEVEGRSGVAVLAFARERR